MFGYIESYIAQQLSKIFKWFLLFVVFVVALLTYFHSKSVDEAYTKGYNEGSANCAVKNPSSK